MNTFGVDLFLSTRAQMAHCKWWFLGSVWCGNVILIISNDFNSIHPAHSAAHWSGHWGMRAGGRRDIWIEDIDNLVTGDRPWHMSRALHWCHVTFVTWCHDTDVSPDIVIMTPDPSRICHHLCLIDMTPNYGDTSCDHYWSSHYHCHRIHHPLHHSRWSLQTLVTSLCCCHRLEWNKIIKMSIVWIYWSPTAYSL